MINLEENVSLKGYTVIFPSVCVGNVAQLAADLIISTLELKKIATAWHPAIIPVIGPRAFDHTTSTDADTHGITTACELFASDSHKLACFQLRSPLAPALLPLFFDALVDFLVARQASELIILTSSFSHEQHSIEMVKFVHLPSEGFRAKHRVALEDNLAWTEWEQLNGGAPIHGGGFALKMWNHFEQRKFPVCLLFKYVSEGDNRTDAVHVFDQLDRLVDGRILGDKNGPQVKMPVSWKALFGNDPDPTEQLY